MVQLIKKGGLRERANRSRSYQGSENTQTTLKPNRYSEAKNNQPIDPNQPLRQPDLEPSNPDSSH